MVTGSGSTELRGLRKAIHDALSAHPKIEKTPAGAVRCGGRDCHWRKPDGAKSTTARFLNHQTFEVQQAVTAWVRDREEGERVSRETLHVLRRD